MLKYLKSLNVLLVEDDLKMQDSLSSILGHFFKEVFIASDGIEALKILKVENIHMLYTDYEMPNMNGYELIKEIRVKDKKLPISVISNHDDKEKLQACMPLGLLGYIFKPITYDMIKKNIELLSKYLSQNGMLTYKFSDIHSIEFIENILYENDTPHRLTKMESAFLKLLISLDGRVATFETIEYHLSDFELAESTLWNIIYRMKKKYNFYHIKSVKDMGYVLDTQC